MKKLFLFLIFLLLPIIIFAEEKITVDYYNIGVEYSKVGDYTKAIEAFQKAVQINPQDADAWFGLGNACEKTEQIENAIYAYNKCVSIKSMGGAYFNLAAIYEKQGKIQEAKDNYLRAKEIFQIQQRYEDVKIIEEALQKLPSSDKESQK